MFSEQATFFAGKKCKINYMFTPTHKKGGMGTGRLGPPIFSSNFADFQNVSISNSYLQPTEKLYVLRFKG